MKHSREEHDADRRERSTSTTGELIRRHLSLATHSSLSLLPCKHPDRRTCTANRARRCSTFDSRRRTTSSSTSPPQRRAHSTFFSLTLILLDRTFDRRIAASQRRRSASSERIHRTLEAKEYRALPAASIQFDLLRRRKRLPGITELNSTEMKIGRVISFWLRFSNVGTQKRTTT